MHNRRKLWSIFGPVILAFVLIVVLFSLPIKNKHSTAMEKQAAVSLSPVVFKNQSIKQQAMSNHQTKFVPFFGSSELRRMDKYHPSVMAARYHNYTPFLFGSRGTQSLPQFFKPVNGPKGSLHYFSPMVYQAGRQNPSIQVL